MNILFLYYNEIIPENGGVQRVTSVLADYFEHQGINTYYLSLHKSINKGSNSSRQYFLPSTDDFNKNTVFFKDFIQSKGINILVNQSGIRHDVSRYAYLAYELDVKVISVINNSILSGILNFKSLYKTQARKYKIAFLLPLTDLKIVKNALLFLYKLKYQNHYKNLYANSDKVIQLSVKFREELNFLNVGVGSKNILCIPNPVSFFPESINLDKKRKEVLYVGRIDTIYKRLDLLLAIWERLYQDFPDWQLKIVGGGEELVDMVSLAKKMNLQRVSFEGFQDPRSYFQDASIFCMTSSSESFGIVLLEAMNYGTVPFAFNSYKSVTDIIDHEVNGIVIPPFDCNKYAQELALLMKDNQRCQELALSAQQKAKEFSIDKIGAKWLNLFDELLLSK